MENFRTVLALRNWDFSIEYPSSHFLIGSCFSEHIGEKLSRSKFRTTLNPFGILFHPFPIARVLGRMMENQAYSDEDLEFNDDRYISYDHHGHFNHTDKNLALSRINETFEKGKKALENADFIYITWGTANAYTHIKQNKVVSNCHKVNAAEFKKERSSVADIVSKYRELVKQIIAFNPKAKIIFSVSPVKHLKDGIIENNLSKSTLLLAANELERKFDNVYYFPSFDILQDDLRDYRFYSKDMAHPNEIAIEYIWNYFKQSLWTKKTQELNKRIIGIQQALEHRPLHPENEAHQLFLKDNKKKIAQIEQEFPFLSFPKN